MDLKVTFDFAGEDVDQVDDAHARADRCEMDDFVQCRRWNFRAVLVELRVARRRLQRTHPDGCHGGTEWRVHTVLVEPEMESRDKCERK